MSRWTYPHGTLDQGVPDADGVFTDWEVSVTDRLEGWTHTTLRVVTLGPGGYADLTTVGEEVVVVPLSTGADVEVRRLGGDAPARVVRLEGRGSVFDGPTDVVYVPQGHHLRIRSHDDRVGRVAVAGAYVTDTDGRGSLQTRGREVTHLAADDVPVELRGAGQASREVRNFGVPGVLDATNLIACEVVTPEGNWSSYPPHKHDEERPGEETRLEEIYYHEVRVTPGSPAPEGADPHGYLRVYASAPERTIDELTPVRTGDVVLVPHGWHGPAMAVPGYDLYYLNVMAGPGPERAWLICDDPAHGWVRSTWADQPVDPRLPLGGSR